MWFVYTPLVIFYVSDAEAAAIATEGLCWYQENNPGALREDRFVWSPLSNHPTVVMLRQYFAATNMNNWDFVFNYESGRFSHSGGEIGYRETPELEAIVDQVEELFEAETVLFEEDREEDDFREE